jgi:hypothetical protein
LAATAVGFVVAIVEPPLVLVLLVISGILAIRDRHSPNKKTLAIFGGLAITTCSYLGLALAHH